LAEAAFRRDFKASSNGRFDAALDFDDLKSLSDVVDAMSELAAVQHAVGRQSVPLLAIWGVDAASTAQLEELTAVTAAFLETVRPDMLMLTGRRAPAVARQAEVLLRRVLGAPSGFKPEKLITGGADGIDAVALRLANEEPPASPGLKVTGEYTPTAFARADMPDDKLNPNPVALQGLSPGKSPIRPASSMVPRQYGDADFHEFLSVMEGQWEARDTANAQRAHACLAFLTHDPARGKGHDGTKATLNIFAAGRYAHPLPDGAADPWEAGAEGEARSPGVVELAGSPTNGFVGYKLHNTPAAAQQRKAAPLSLGGIAAAMMSAIHRCLRRFQGSR